MVKPGVIGLLLICILPELIVCPPVTEKPVEPSTEAPVEDEEDVVSQLAYEKYLKEVMSVLMADSEFNKKVIEAGSEFALKSGEIARHLDFVGHGIRTRLDEIKRKEVDRIRQIIRLQAKMQQGTDDDDDGDDKGMKSLNVNWPGVDKDRLLAHIDPNNPNTFEVEDLSRLIKQATSDLEEIDRKRRSEFKNYELEKEHLRKKQLEEMDEQKRVEAEQKFEEMKKKHAEHPKIHHPGAEAQLKEVWEESDGLNTKDFDPRTFFFLHDTNSDGQLDAAEIEALFQKELDKVYDPNAPEDDMVERYEEMNRMREHIMKEVDTNQDQMVSLEEFLNSTKKTDFKQDEGWDTLDQQKVFTDEELAAFEKQYEELRRQQHLQQEQPHQQQQQPQAVPVDHQAPGQQAAAKDHLDAGHQAGNVNIMHQDNKVLPQAVADQPIVHQEQREHPAAVHQEQPPQKPVVNHEEHPVHQEQQQQLPVQ